MASVDWLKIKSDYVTGTESYRMLADKYGVPRTTLYGIAKKEQWVDARMQYRSKLEAKTLEKAAGKGIDYKSTLYELAYKVASQLVSLTDDHSVGDLIALGIKPRDITGAIKDLEDILHVKSERDIREQEARIASLKKQVEDEQSKEIKVTFTSEVEDYAE